MKKLRCTLALMFLFAASSTASAAALTDPTGDDPVKIEAPSNPASMTAEQWEAYCEKLETALASENDGLRQGALRMIIQYGHYMEFGRLAVFDAVRLYRDHKDARIRRMATVALLKMNDSWAFDFLERSVAFEKNTAVKYTILAVLASRPSDAPSDARSSTF